MADPPPSDKRDTPPKRDNYTSSLNPGRFRFKSSDSRKRSERATSFTEYWSSSNDSSNPPKRIRRRSPSARKKSTHKNRPSHRSTQSHIQPDLGDAPPRDLSPNAAFRESLFDAMGDDEGAQYWESVYGQPIHNYPVPEVERPTGQLEQMNEEEYAAYVRARMWERTQEGMREERERQREERRKLNSPSYKGTFLDQQLSGNLRRMRLQDARKAWEDTWEKYLSSWTEIAKVVDSLKSTTTTPTVDVDAESSTEVESIADPAPPPLRNLLVWPVKSGKRCDVTPEAVKEFLTHATPKTDLSVVLKTERVRWHPDKIQQRYGALGIGENVMRSVTQVFQIIDQMWTEKQGHKN